MESRLSGVDSVESLFKVADYASSRAVLEQVTDAISTMMMETFLTEDSVGKSYSQAHMEEVRQQLQQNSTDSDRWGSVKSSENLMNFYHDYQNFVVRKSTVNENFRFWLFYVDNIYSICRDLTQSHRLVVIKV